MQYEFIGEAGAHASQLAILHWGTDKRATHAKGSDWSLTSRSVIQGDSLDNYNPAAKPPSKLKSECSEFTSIHQATASTSVDRPQLSTESDLPVQLFKTERALASSILGECDAQEKRVLRTVVEEEVIKLEDQLKQTSYQFLTVIEALKRPVPEQPSCTALIIFVKQARAELVRFSEKFETQLRHRPETCLSNRTSSSGLQ